MSEGKVALNGFFMKEYGIYGDCSRTLFFQLFYEFIRDPGKSRLEEANVWFGIMSAAEEQLVSHPPAEKN